MRRRRLIRLIGDLRLDDESSNVLSSVVSHHTWHQAWHDVFICTYHRHHTLVDYIIL